MHEQKQQQHWQSSDRIVQERTQAHTHHTLKYSNIGSIRFDCRLCCTVLSPYFFYSLFDDFSVRFVLLHLCLLLKLPDCALTSAQTIHTHIQTDTLKWLQQQVSVPNSTQLIFQWSPLCTFLSLSFFLCTNFFANKYTHIYQQYKIKRIETTVNK